MLPYLEDILNHINPFWSIIITWLLTSMNNHIASATISIMSHEIDYRALLFLTPSSYREC